MPNLPVPSGGGKRLTELFGRKVTRIEKKAANAVQTQSAHSGQIAPNAALSGSWTIEDLQGYIKANNGRLPDFMQPGAQTQPGANQPPIHVHITMPAAPTQPVAPVVEPQSSQKSTERVVLELMGRGMLLMFKKLLESTQSERRASERARERDHEIHIGRLKLRHQRERNNRFNGAINNLVGHFFGLAMFMVVALFLFALLAIAPRWNYYPGWWDYPPPPPPQYYRRQDY